MAPLTDHHHPAIKREYFDSVAPRWNSHVDVRMLKRQLREALLALKVPTQGTIVDLGCGTGILAGVLAELLGSAATSIGVDFSTGMIDIARQHVNDRRMRWLVADAGSLPLRECIVDAVLCFSAWPHFPRPEAVGLELKRVLRSGGTLTVLHLLSRHRLALVHANAGDPVRNDLLPPADELAALLERLGFDRLNVVDSEDMYLVSVRRR